MLGRRKFLGTVGATAVALAAARTLRGVGSRPAAIGGKAALPGGGAAAGALAEAGVRPSARFAGCEILGVERAADGAFGVRFADRSGKPFDVDLLAFDPRTPGVARAGSLAVYMNNHGNGATATIEEHGLAAMALARHLSRREAAGIKLPVMPALRERSTGSGSTPV
jgi:hypothetical protein